MDIKKRQDRGNCGDTVFDFALMMRYAMDKAITKENTSASFRKTGLCPWNPEALFRPGLPLSKDNATTLISAEDINKDWKPGRNAWRMG